MEFWIHLTIVLWIGSNVSGYIGGGGGGFPYIPWLTVPQSYAGRPNHFPNPPIFAQSASADQDLAYASYRWDMFYQPRTDAPTTAGPATSPATDATGSEAPGSAEPGMPAEIKSAATVDKVENVMRGNVTFSKVDPRQKGGQTCRSLGISGPNSNRDGICVNQFELSKKCRGVSGPAPSCRPTQRCCLGTVVEDA